MSSDKSSVRVTMVKKRLANGEPCRKCAQAEDMLKRRGLWELIDEVVIADENDLESAGMVLAKQHGVDVAPFFLVTDGQQVQVFDSVIKLAKDVLAPRVDESASKFAAAESIALAEVPGLKARVEEGAESLRGASPARILDFALENLGERCAIAFSGAEDVVLIDMAAKSGRKFSVFCLDTGRLHPETYRFLDTVRQFYGIELRVVSPDFVSLEALVRKKGLFSFYEEGHHECCGVRKLEPLRRLLSDYDGWVTGQRRDQSPTRAEVPELGWDTVHRGEGMLKANPLAGWSQEEVWEYIRENGVPYNELHDDGYVSIGCEPCTRARRPGEHERAARWWWEDATKRECGLHVK
jgi:phosphoadenosine phosphosulfate reductase